MKDLAAIPHIQPRMLEVAKLKATGLTTKEVAHSLGISDQTVKNHLSNLYAILGVSTFEGALHALGWVFPGGLTPETLAAALERSTYLQSSHAHEALDRAIAEGLDVIRQARAFKALLKAVPND